MDQVYRISGQRLEGIGDQVRRLGNSTEKLTPAQMQQLLAGLTLGAGGNMFETNVAGRLPFLVKSGKESLMTVNFTTEATGTVWEESV